MDGEGLKSPFLSVHDILKYNNTMSGTSFSMKSINTVLEKKTSNCKLPHFNVTLVFNELTGKKLTL